MYHLIIAVLTVWFVLCFFDYIFKSCLFHPYFQFMHITGLTIQPLYLKCYITRFNRLLRRWICKRKLMRCWFDVGAVVTCLLILPSMGLLFFPALAALSPHEETQAFSQILQPVVPGYNLPISQIMYYLFTLLLCSVFHELGHALASVRENVPITGCGFYIFVVIPAAFVEMCKEPLFSVSPWQQLRIFCAGIWHNIVLSVCSILLLLLNPTLLSPIYLQNSGISVLDVQGSALSNPSGLSRADHIIFVNSCRTDNMESWKSCLKEVALNPPNGYCVSESFISSNVRTVKGLHSGNCCGNSSSHLCFKHVLQDIEKLSCLPVRDLIASSSGSCHNQSSCGKDTCVTPILEPQERLIVITRQNKPEVLYVGLPTELFAGVSVSPWVAKLRFLPVRIIHVYETFLKYIVSFSSALAVLNLVPCPGLDGQYLVQILVDRLTKPFLPKATHRQACIFVLKLCGCLLLAVNIFLALQQLVVTR